MTQVVPLRARPSHEATTARIGMIVFVAGWTMMFGALLVAYLLLRTGQPEGASWPSAGLPRVPRALPTVATCVLLASSGTLALAVGSIRAARPRALIRWLWMTLLLALVFLGLQTTTWLRMRHLGLAPGASLYASSFFGLTLFHALHVIVGMLGLLSLLPRSYRGAFSAHGHTAVQSWALYWHFVDVAWIAFYVAVVVW
ncbi:MAG: cytochrome c oxidase subunit 3 [Polyangia bacterium]